MSPDRRAMQGSKASSGCLALSFFLLLIPIFNATADEILQAGKWEGSYQPPESGDSVQADFIVERIQNSRAGDGQVWTVTMYLRLPPPINKPMTFLEIKDHDQELWFVLDMTPKSTCRLLAGEFGELSGLCYENTWGEGPSARITMKPPVQVQSEDQAPTAPENTDESPPDADGDGTNNDEAEPAGAE